MASTIRIKKRASSGSAGAPSSLASSELAFNENASDKKLYYGYGDNGSGVATSVIAIGGPGAFCDLTTAQTVAGDKTFSDNLVVSGNLTVNGTTTSIQTTNSVVKDALIELGNGTSGSPSNDAGLVIERGSSANAFIGWDESADKFIVGTTTNVGSDTGNLSITGGTLVATTFEGALTGNVTGNVTGNTSGSAGSCTGNSATATEATNITASANNSTDETVYPVFVDGATGTQGIETDTGLTYNPSSGLLTSTSFAGNITGNVTGNASGSSGSCTGNAATATLATSVTVTANNSTDETVYPVFVDGATGTQGAETDTGLSYNPSSGLLTTTSLAAIVDGGTF